MGLCLLGALSVFPIRGIAAQYQLENEWLRLTFDDSGSLVELTDRQEKPERNLIVHPLPGFWRLIFHRGQALENAIRPEQQKYRFTRTGDTLEIAVDEMRFENESIDISATFRVRLEGDEVQWAATVVNRAPVILSELFLPEIGGIDGLGGEKPDDLIWPQGAGRRVRNVKKALHAGLDSRVASLAPIENPVNEVGDPRLTLVYPSGWPNPASMNWFELTNEHRGIYFGSHDARFTLGAMSVTRQMGSGGTLKFAFVKYPFVRQGETWESGDYVVSPHAGDWHHGARKYRAWAASWFKPTPKPEWIRKMKGMFLVILRQQYGDVMWKYDDLPFLYSEAKKSGLDTVGLFGWTEAGHDNQYPIYNPDPAMGGEAELRRGLAAITAAGGKSILYIQGHLLDPTTEFYREKGYKMAAKNIWGSPYYEQYNKFNQSSFLENFSRKLFVPVWPGDPNWIQLMSETGRRVMDLGPTGIIFDQLGGMAYPCFDNSAGVRPSEAFATGRKQLLTTLRDDLRRVRPDSGMMIEHLTDAYAQHADIMHAVSGMTIGDASFPQLFRYTFPDVISTTRFPAPRVDPKQVNFALACGLRFELEVRYRPDVDTLRQGAGSELRDYFRSVSLLRDRYWDLIGSGTFQDTDGVVNKNLAISATVFSHADRLAVVLWNKSGEEQPVQITVPGKTFREAANIDGPLSGVPVRLKPQQVAVAIFQ